MIWVKPEPGLEDGIPSAPAHPSKAAAAADAPAPREQQLTSPFASAATQQRAAAVQQQPPTTSGRAHDNGDNGDGDDSGVGNEQEDGLSRNSGEPLVGVNVESFNLPCEIVKHLLTTQKIRLSVGESRLPAHAHGLEARMACAWHGCGVCMARERAA